MFGQQTPFGMSMSGQDFSNYIKSQTMSQIHGADSLIAIGNPIVDITVTIDKDTIQNCGLEWGHTVFNNDTTQKDPDSQIPINPPKVPHNKIPDSIINSKKKLKLIIKQSKYLPEDKELIINAGGLVGSPRNAKDGITFFGDVGVIYYILFI